VSKLLEKGYAVVFGKNACIGLDSLQIPLVRHPEFFYLPVKLYENAVAPTWTNSEVKLLAPLVEAAGQQHFVPHQSAFFELNNCDTGLIYTCADRGVRAHLHDVNAFLEDPYFGLSELCEKVSQFLEKGNLVFLWIRLKPESGARRDGPRRLYHCLGIEDTAAMTEALIQKLLMPSRKGYPGHLFVASD
jgi:hypothetical protein